MVSDEVFRLAPPPNPPVPLPQVPGPKLAPFTPTAYADNIEFIRFIGRDNDRDSQVWAVKINNQGPYALKMCRAYGRLKDEGREDLHVVKAYGYLLLTPEQEADVGRELCDYYENEDEELDGENTWGRFEQHRGYPVRAIVKELVGRVFRAAIPHLWSDLEELHKLGILVRDIHEGNYMGRKLIDFSRSLTMYHPLLDRVSPLAVRGFRRDDALGLEEMIMCYSDCHPHLEEPIDALESIQQKIREGTGNFGHDPREYDWRRFEESPEKADAYVSELLTDNETFDAFGAERESWLRVLRRGRR